jgi:hypothetical protein
MCAMLVITEKLKADQNDDSLKCIKQNFAD